MHGNVFLARPRKNEWSTQLFPIFEKCCPFLQDVTISVRKIKAHYGEVMNIQEGID